MIFTSKKFAPSKATALLIVLAGLWLLKIIFSQAARAAVAVEAAPEWLGPALTAFSGVLGAVIFIVVVALVAMHGRKFITLLTSAFTPAETEAAADKTPETGGREATALTKDLSKTVVALERYGDKSGELVREAQLQTAALVGLVKALATKATDMAAVAESFQGAFTAINTADPIQVAQAAGRVKDGHIRDLMLLPYEQGDAAYWQNVSRLIASQLGAAERWQNEYSKMAGSLMGEVATIKTRLIAASAHIEMARAARPLLQAQVNLDTAAHHLRIPVSEGSSPTRLFAPRNEYLLSSRGGR